MPKIPLTSFRKILIQALSPAARNLAVRFTKELPQLRKSLYPELLRAKQGYQFKLSDFPELNPLRELLEETQALPAPKEASGFRVTAEDYAKQATISYIDKSGNVAEITLEQMIDYQLAGIPSLETGSNKTFEAATASAQDFFKTMGLESGTTQYLAMDADRWMEPDVIPLFEKNIMNTMPQRYVNSLVNEARLQNPTIEPSISFSHSYANFPGNLSLLLNDPMDVWQGRFVEMAPLSLAPNMSALVDVKNGSFGKVSVVRPEFDIFEELASGHGAALGNEVYEILPTDMRLPVSSHKLAEITKGLKKYLDDNNLTIEEFSEKFYTERPASITISTASDGEVEITKEEATWTAEQFEKAYNEAITQSLDAQKEALENNLKTQAEQVTEVAKYHTSPELEKTATEIKENQEALQNSTSDTLPQVVESVNSNAVAIQTQLASQIEIASESATEAWKENMDKLQTDVADFAQQYENESTKMEDIEAGDTPVKVEE